MRSSTMKQTIKEMFPLKRTLSLIGPPGCGKTSVVRAVAEELGIGYIEKHMPTMLVEDFGIPDMLSKDSVFKYKLPDWFPAEDRDDLPEEGILCFDDRNQAGPDLQKVLANIQQARTLHGIPIKAGWMVISTGNRQEDRAGANRILSHLSNRETVIELEPDLNDCTKWMLTNGVCPEVISFLRFKPELLIDFDANRDQNPTPRSWSEGVSPLVGNVSRDAEYECYKGSVGEGAAVEFTGYLRVCRSLPDPDKIIKDPSYGKIPEKADALFAISGAIAYRANRDNIGNVFEFAKRLPPEYETLLVATVIRKDEDITETEVFCKWLEENGDFLQSV